MPKNDHVEYADSLEGRPVEEETNPRREAVRYDHGTPVDENTLHDKEW